MKNALFHPKVWLFREGDDVIAAHGSSNMTYAGIQKNIEQMSISKSWDDSNQQYITEKFCDQFRNLWANQDIDCTVVSMPQAIEENLLKTYNSALPPTEEDFHMLYKQATGAMKESDSTYDLDKSLSPFIHNTIRATI